MNRSPLLSRRALLAGTAGLAFTGAKSRQGEAATQSLTVTTRILDVKGRAAKVFGILGPDGKPGLSLTYGSGFHATVENRLSEETLIHWHGQLPPLAMDGSPMFSGAALQPGEKRNYDFDRLETGTHWMHSHMGLQEQQLLAAPLIVKEAGEALFDEQEHVVILHDFTFREPTEILSELQGGKGGHAMHGEASAKMDHSAHANMAAMPAHLSDISYDAMLANDRTLDDPEVVVAAKGGRFRLRIINAASATNYWIDLGEIEGTLIAVDGKGVEHVKARRFPLAMAQRVDIRLALPAGSGSWPVLFQSEGATQRSGIILKAGQGVVAKISDQGLAGEALDLELETKLRSVVFIRDEPVNRVEMLMLTGGGADYVWGLNGKPSMHDIIASVREGERYEIMFHNMTSMSHPMHLHGHYFQVVEINGQRISGAVRDTVLVPVGATVTIRFDADNPGTWPLHCHHLYHMNAGMMGAISYISAA